MAPSSPAPASLDEVRAAFNRLSTADKTAFVLEATFQTIGQAVGETGRRVSETLQDLDLETVFNAPCGPKAAPGAAEAAAPPPEPAPAPPKRSRRPPSAPEA
jgi:hypothetical protein